MRFEEFHLDKQPGEKVLAEVGELCLTNKRIYKLSSKRKSKSVFRKTINNQFSIKEIPLRHITSYEYEEKYSLKGINWVLLAFGTTLLLAPAVSNTIFSRHPISTTIVSIVLLTIGVIQQQNRYEKITVHGTSITLEERIILSKTKGRKFIKELQKTMLKKETT